jgi:signal transduction histidine kinase/ActR/RegA family two-component response regulator
MDSLNIVIHSTKNNTVKAIALSKLAHEYIDGDSKKAYALVKESIELSERIKAKSTLISALNELSNLERNNGNYSGALATLKKAIQLAELSKDTVSIIKCFMSVGDVYSALKSYDKALNYYEEALLLNQNKLSLDAVNSLSRIGNRLMDKGGEAHDTSFMFSAISSYLKAKNMAYAIKQPRHYINTYVSLADAYNILGNVSGNKHHLYESLQYSMLSLQLAQGANIKPAQGISYINLGEVYLNLNKTVKALHYFEMAEKIYGPLGSKTWLMITYEMMGKTYYKMRVYDKAIEYINKSIGLATEQQLAKHLSTNYYLLAEIYSKEKRFEEACSYYKLYNNYKDSVNNENALFNITRLQTELDLQGKDKEIALLTKNTEAQNLEITSKKNQRNSLILLIIVILVVLAFVYYLYNEKKQLAFEILMAKEAAEQAKETQEQFLANTSHEIRTPMNGIIGMTNHLIDTPLNAEQQEYVQTIKESSNNLLSIVNELLDFSKIISKKITFDKEPFEPELVIKNLIHLLEFRALEKSNKLTYQIHSNVPKVLVGDAVRLNQVLLNLVENSVKFTHHGTIDIAISLLHETNESAELEFKVKDSGIGIPENKLNSIFENFSQVDSKTTRKYGGTGLGLSISKQLVEQQSGKISVISKVNEGSEFNFTLTFKKQVEKNILTGDYLTQLSSTPQANLHGASVLIVDDNKINLRVANLTLQKWNVKTELAESAGECYQILQEKNIDLILMDITMPDIDGLQATQYIRSHFNAPICDIPIIAMTAAAFMDDKERCLRAGMNDYISKPFSAEELLQKLISYLPSQTPDQNKNFSDLSLIYERADGDMVFLKEILECYIVEMPGYIREMNEFLQEKDYTGICKQAHKMKAPIALMGAISLKELYAGIETSARENLDIHEISRQIEIAEKQCLETIEELKSEFFKLQ